MHLPIVIRRNYIITTSLSFRGLRRPDIRAAPPPLLYSPGHEHSAPHTHGYQKVRLLDISLLLLGNYCNLLLFQTRTTLDESTSEGSCLFSSPGPVAKQQQQQQSPSLVLPSPPVAAGVSGSHSFPTNTCPVSHKRVTNKPDTGPLNSDSKAPHNDL